MILMSILFLFIINLIMTQLIILNKYVIYF